MRGAGGPVTLNIQSFSEKGKHPFIHLDKNRPSFRVNTGRLSQARALQKPLRLGHSHASMAAALALHGFTGFRPQNVPIRPKNRLCSLHGLFSKTDVYTKVYLVF